MDVVPTTAGIPSTLNPSPRYCHEFQSHSRGYTAMCSWLRCNEFPIKQCLMGNSLHRSQLEPTVAYRSAVSLETTEIPHSARSSFRTQFEDNSDW